MDRPSRTSRRSRRTGPARDGLLAETLGALIDGVYLRAVLDGRGPAPDTAHAMVRRWLDEALTRTA